MSLLIFILVLLVIIISIVIGILYFIWSAKKTLLKDQASWSAKEMPIKRKKNNPSQTPKKGMLLEIEEQANAFLDSQIEKDM